MNLYVCWTKRELHLPRRGGHPCANAYKALRDAGHDPEVTRAYGFGGLPAALQSAARKRVKEGTGKSWVPALQTDDGRWIAGSEEIVAWAAEPPAAT